MSLLLQNDTITGIHYISRRCFSWKPDQPGEEQLTLAYTAVPLTRLSFCSSKKQKKATKVPKICKKHKKVRSFSRDLVSFPVSSHLVQKFRTLFQQREIYCTNEIWYCRWAESASIEKNVTIISVYNNQSTWFVEKSIKEQYNRLTFSAIPSIGRKLKSP
jgi:hypothetical protein